MSSNLYSGTGNTGRRAGVVALSIDGEVVDVAGDLEYDVTQFDRKTQVGQSSVQGFSEMPKAGFIAFNIRDAKSFSMSALNAKTDASIVCLTATGKTVTGDGMWNVDPQSVNTTDGTCKVRFEGPSVVES